MSDDDREQLDFYTNQARSLAAGIESAVEEYEDGHPPSAPCFAEVLASLRQVKA